MRNSAPEPFGATYAFPAVPAACVAGTARTAAARSARGRGSRRITVQYRPQLRRPRVVPLSLCRTLTASVRRACRLPPAFLEATQPRQPRRSGGRGFLHFWAQLKEEGM